MTFDASQIVTCAQREAVFHQRYPDGRITFEFKGTMDGNESMIWGVARVYRDPDDRIPVTGTASEAAVGLTPYTKGAELSNLETSCVSRALRFLGCIPASGAETMTEVVREAERRESASEKPTKAPRGKAILTEPTPPAPADFDPWLADAGFTPIEPEDMSEAADPPKCKHGPREWKEGVSSSGKPWRAWMCSVRNGQDKCPPEWR